MTAPTHSWVHVVEHHARQTRYAWRGIVISGVLNPVFTMLALGWGVGALVDDPISLGTQDFMHFVGPGVVAGSALLRGGFYSLWEALAALRWEGMYKNSVRTPASHVDVLTGRLVWGFLRFTFSAALFCVVLLALIDWKGWLALAAAPVAGLTGLAVAAPVLAYSARQENDGAFSLLSRMLLTPLFVFSGTFTPVDSMPSAVEALVKLFPGYHGIELCRDLLNARAALGGSLSHLAVIAAWTVGGWFFARNAFAKALTR